MNKEKVIAIIKHESFFLFFIFPILYGFMSNLYPIFGWITALMIGHILENVLFMKGIMFFCIIVLVGGLFATFLFPTHANFLAFMSVPLLIICGWIISKK